MAQEKRLDFGRRLAGEKAQKGDEFPTLSQFAGVSGINLSTETNFDLTLSADAGAETDTTNFDNNLSAADTTVQKALETLDELVTGSSSVKSVCFIPFKSTVNCAVGNGEVAFTVPADLNGLDLSAATASCHTQGSGGTMDIQIRRRRAGSDVDMLSTKITMGAEYHASDGVIDGTKDDLLKGDQIYVDVDSVHTTTPAKGLSVTVSFS